MDVVLNHDCHDDALPARPLWISASAGMTEHPPDAPLLISPLKGGGGSRRRGDDGRGVSRNAPTMSLGATTRVAPTWMLGVAGMTGVCWLLGGEDALYEVSD